MEYVVVSRTRVSRVRGTRVSPRTKALVEGGTVPSTGRKLVSRFATFESRKNCGACDDTRLFLCAVVHLHGLS